MVQMTLQSYRRSLQEFSESPFMSRCKSLSSSHSLSDAPQSITEWLTFWEKDPVEILLDLGFGTEEPDVCTKIPPRFLSGASVAKGINNRVFLEAQKQRMDVERPNLYERFRQLEVLDHVTSALSSLLTNVNTQQTKAQNTDKDKSSLLDAAKSRLAVTQAKQRIGQLLKRASQQTMLLKQDLLAPGEINLCGRKEQLYPCADIAERGAVQAGFSAPITLDCLSQEQTLREIGASACPTSQHPPTPLGKAWNSSLLAANEPLLSPVCEVPAKDRPRKESPLLVTHTLKNVVGLNCKLPNSFEMEEIQSFEDETLTGNATDITSGKVMVTRTSSCQSDSSGFMEELPEPVGLQNPSFLGNINFLSDIYYQEVTLPYRTVFPMLNQDFQQKPGDGVAKVSTTACKSILTVPRTMKACSDRGEGTLLLLSAENGKCQASNTEPQPFVQELSYGMDKNEDTTEWNQLEKHRFIKDRSPHFQGDTQDGDPSFSMFDYHLYFNTEHKKLNVTFPELSDLSSAVITESKIRGEDEGETCWTEKNVVISCSESARVSHTGPCWGVEVVSKDGTPLEIHEVTNEQKFCKMDTDSKNTRCFPTMRLPETTQWGSAMQTRSSAALSCPLQVSQRHPSCLGEGYGLNSSEDENSGSMGKTLDANKSEQGDTVQNGDILSAPLKSVTVQMSSGLEFTSRLKGTGQNTPLSESLAREDPVDLSDMIAHFREHGPLTWSDLEASKNDVKQTTEASSQTDIPARKSRQPSLLSPPHTHLTKSASLDTMLCGKSRSHCWGETSGATGVPGSHCCHCCCCHSCHSCCPSCCPRTFPVAVSSQHPAVCCSNHAATELELLKMLMLLQDTATQNLAVCPLHEIEAMKSSCQHFQEKLDEIEQHMTEQLELFSGAMPDERREEGRHLQLLRQAVRQEVAELEFQLNEGVPQVRESILMQLDQLLAEQSHLFSELGLSDWKRERKAQNKQAFPDAADTAHPQCGHLKLMLQRVPRKNTTATGCLSVPCLGAPSTQFPTRTTPEPNAPKSLPWEVFTSKKEIKGPPQEKLDFKALMHSLKKSFQNYLGNDSAEGKD
ncbi:protein ITPRID1 isoform X1 [Melanerpes formicivorus]|uniref:protein ITPRID1 isoform X1 n=1 Tax=Melanerpes formicivorus TaxID=211600 RepID=UPI003590150D